MANKLHKLIEQWQRDGIELLPPYEEAEVIQQLASLNRLLSRDIVDLFCTTGGMVDCGMDGKCWSLWPLAHVISENMARQGDFLYFADFLINSYAYALRWESEELSSVYIDYGEGEPERIADSLDEFFHLYLTDPEQIGL